jgi:hypothetical protein
LVSVFSEDLLDVFIYEPNSIWKHLWKFLIVDATGNVWFSGVNLPHALIEGCVNELVWIQ